MKLFTEKEHVDQSQHFAFKLKMLYKNDIKTYYQLQEYLPFPTYVNERASTDYHYFSPSFFSRGVEIENLYRKGQVYLPSISEPILMKKSLEKARLFHEIDDHSSICSFLQIIKMHGEWTPFFTNKIILDENLTLNTSLFPTELQPLKKLFDELLPFGKDHLHQWQRFQKLTKREKQIMKLIVNGKENKEIADILFLSPHSIHTHRRNIYKKLEICKISQLVRIAIAMDVFS